MLCYFEIKSHYLSIMRLLFSQIFLLINRFEDFEEFQKKIISYAYIDPYFLFMLVYML